ncbi:MAG: hypothetical protein ACLFU8_16805, partial [Anaerolineales bacterium]
LLARLANHPRLFVVINTLFWLGLLWLLLSDPLRLVVGGSLLALALGGLMLYGAISPRITREMENPLLTRLLAGSLGAAVTAGGIAGLIWFLSGDFTRRYVDRTPVRETPRRPLSIPWPLLGVIFVTLILPRVGARLIDRRWSAQEARVLEAARQEGRVFPLPPAFRETILWVLLSLGAVTLMFLGEPQTALALLLTFTPVFAAGLYWLLRNSGLVLLTGDAVVLRRLGREKRLPYDEIVELRAQNLKRLFTAFVLQGERRTLRIPHLVTDRAALYTALVNRAPHLHPAAQERPDGGARRAAQRVIPLEVSSWETANNGASDLPSTARQTQAAETLPHLQVKPVVWWLYGLGVLFLALIYVGLGLAPLWSALFSGDAPPFDPDLLKGAAILFLMLSVIFLPALIFAFYALFARKGTMAKHPVEYELYPDRIRYRYLRQSTWEERPARELKRVILETFPVSVQTRAEGLRFTHRVTAHALLLEFAGHKRNKQLVIDRERALQFGKRPENLYELFRRLYPHVQALHRPRV